MTPNQIVVAAAAILQQVAEQHPEFAEKIHSTHIKVDYDTRRVAGRAYVRAETIKLSARIFAIPQNIGGFRETVLHELAHILRCEHGHDPLWKMIAQKIGSTGARCHKLKTIRNKHYMAVCCKCATKIPISAVRKRRLISGEMTYTHNACGGGEIKLDE